MGSDNKFISLSTRTKNVLKLVAIYAALILGLYATVKVASIMLPLVIAMIFAQIMEPLIRLIMRVFRLKRNASAVIAAALLFGVLGILSTLGVARLVREIADLITRMPSLAATAAQAAQQKSAQLQDSISLLHPEIVSLINSLINNIMQSVFSGAKTLAMNIISGAISMPRAILFIVVLVVSTVLMMRGRDTMFDFARRQLPEEWVKRAIGLRDDLLGALLGYVKAQLKIMGVIFIELLIGFSVLGTRYAFLAALCIAMMDALPVFGVGLVLIPTALYNMLLGDLKVGVGCAIMYVCTLVLRNALEPKMLSAEIGLNPLITLASMYAGYRLSGFIGLICGPLLMLVLKNASGVILGGQTIVEYIDQGQTPPAQDDEST